MNISIKQLGAFVAVAESRSFAEACERLHLSQPALSITIKNMEDVLGGPLFIRSTRALALTPEGERLLPMAQRLLTDWHQALGDISDMFSLARGRLSIAAMPSFAEAQLPEPLSEFRIRYPNINISLHDVLNESVLELTRAGRAELGVCFKPVATDDLVFTELFQDEMVALLPAGHSLASETTLTWKMLQQQSVIALAPPSNVRAHMDGLLAEHGLALNIEVEANQLATVKRLVALGVGVSAVPRMCLRHSQELGVVYRPLVQPVVARSIGLVERRRYALSAAAQAMRERILAHCKNGENG